MHQKVVDTIVKSSFCQTCNVQPRKVNGDSVEFKGWYEKHQKYCAANHYWSAGKMEIDGIVEMLVRSNDKHDVQYAKYIGNGDVITVQ